MKLKKKKGSFACCVLIFPISFHAVKCVLSVVSYMIKNKFRHIYRSYILYRLPLNDLKIHMVSDVSLLVNNLYHILHIITFLTPER